MISIIIPVYNAEKTLHQCVDSILFQKYKDFELILVDDGSQDLSPAICDEYAAKDSRIIVFHKESGGVSSARNVGLHQAKGEWITFIDSDDYISADFLNVPKSCTQHLYVTGFRDDINGTVCENVRLSSAIYQNKEDVRQFIRTQVSSSMVLRGPWGKFFRRELLENQYFNTSMKLGEDTCFVFDYLAKCKTIEVDASAFYVIRRGAIPDNVKYRSSVDYAVFSLNYVWKSFIRMEDVHQLGHEYFYPFIGYYKLMCRHEWIHHLASWYLNPEVNRMFLYATRKKISFTIIKYHLLRCLSHLF